jgi:hypothetical protein
LKEKNKWEVNFEIWLTARILRKEKEKRGEKKKPYPRQTTANWNTCIAPSASLAHDVWTTQQLDFFWLLDDVACITRKLQAVFTLLACT